MLCCSCEKKKPEKESDHVLTEQDKSIIIRSWRNLSETKIMEDIGTEIMMGLLTTHPETKDIFNKFKNIRMSELKGSEILRDHGLKVTSILDKAIFRIKDPEAQIRILLNEGALHMDNAIEERYLKTMGEYFIKGVKKRNKKNWNKHHQQAWEKFFAMVSENMLKGGEIKRLSYMLKENELEKANVI